MIKTRLHQVDVRQGLDGLGLGSDIEEVSLLGLGVLSLQRLVLGLASTNGGLVLVVLVSAGKDLFLAGGGLQVGNGNVKVLLKDTSIDLLVDNYADSSLGDVEHNAGTAVVVSVRHALVDRGVNLDINIVTSLLFVYLGYFTITNRNLNL